MTNRKLHKIAGLTAGAQVQKEQLNLMPWPQNVVINEGNFNLTKNFKVNITGNPNARIFGGVTRFLRRLDGRTGMFFQQGFITKKCFAKTICRKKLF